MPMPINVTTPGLGGDRLLPAVAGVEAGSSQGRAIADRKKELFEALMPRLQLARWR